MRRRHSGVADGKPSLRALLSRDCRLPGPTKRTSSAAMAAGKAVWMAQARSTAGSMMVAASCGVAVGWASSAVVKLQDRTGPFQLTDDQASWVVSLNDVGILLGSLLSGLCFSVLGRRATLLLCPLLLLGWAALTFAATAPAFLYVARLLSGAGMAVHFVYGNVYLAEVSVRSSRGLLSLLTSLFAMAGTLLQFCVGPYVSYRTQAWLGALPAAAALVLLLLFTVESPYYLAMRDRPDEMLAALARLRGCSVESDALRDEAHEIERTVERQRSAGSLLAALCSPASRRAASVGVVVQATAPLFGESVLMAYAQKIFIISGSPLGDAQSAIVLYVAQASACLACTALVDRWGRRTLLSVSCLGNCIGMAVLSAYLGASPDRQGPLQWIPLASLLLFVVSCSLGANPVPGLLLAELLPQRAKPLMAPLSMMLFSVTAFAVSKSFLALGEAAGMFAPFAVFAAWNALAVAFTRLFVPETKNKSLAEVYGMLSGREEAPKQN
ncbi:facilitated trehalose transporter Tret1-like isoform X3 [Thrips palmi]|uniref:Facilitated trehalose transporter Tret1-like isoform X3 n=1 Tax=Thrips palmi TaxID=161013 RepID=A0A6P8YGI7_THRPL|nr:facilitated trehalose transporter Tret1-like isoform X3 [Thrips palmi]